ncbi:MAG: MoxR family ATPase, partial [Myxococcota bacterium]
MVDFSTVDAVEEALQKEGYVADSSLAMSVFLAVKMGRPLFLEGAPGVGKTEVARVLSRVLRAELIRLQCYEGLDVHQALYEWNYRKQLLQL